MTSLNSPENNNISDLLSGLNDRQKEAVLCTEGPLLILAGAGSGKTRVIVHRVARLIEMDVPPGSILAITFTNKAAGEMRERIDQLVGFAAGEIWVSTFHSACVRILRRNAELIGYTRYFSIYDADDQLKVVKDLCKALEINTKEFREKGILHAISRAKDELITPERYKKEAYSDFEHVVARVYARYEEVLKSSNAFDFDDLIGKTIRLLKENQKVLDFYQERFQYILVDEYQDTNTAQFELVRLLAGKYRNLCVVGDDDQSIYRFRGANIMNILSFEETYPDAKVVRLEQNYRSTERILECANEVISHNTGRKRKTLWTDNPTGEKIRFAMFESGFEEADAVSADIARRVRAGEADYRDIAVLYRTNAQSRLFEEKFLLRNLPYKLVGGVNFYARLEIKDTLAYLKTICNAQDDLAVKRIINVPKRGIGNTSIEKLSAFAAMEEQPFFEVLPRAKEAGLSGKAAEKVKTFYEEMLSYREKAQTMTIAALIEEVLEGTGYLGELRAEHTEEADGRIENLDELISKAVSYAENTEFPTLEGFLEEVALIADIDTVSDSDDVVLLMTLHAAKGLEFPYVYMAGMEEDIFPGYMAREAEDDAAMEEERRLAYVGITRAKKQLLLSAARQRMIRGEVRGQRISRFVTEIPRELVETGFAPAVQKKEAAPALSKAFTKADASLRNAISRPEMKRTPYSAAKPFPVKKGEALSYAVGDTVHHTRFGNGKVLKITEGGRDYEVTVDFPSVGVKKMFAQFANLVKVEE